MTVDEGAERLRCLIAEAGSDADRPLVAIAWEGFKAFVVEPLADRTVDVWFEAADGDPDRGDPAYCDFVRMVTREAEDGADWDEQITAHFSAPPEARIGLNGRVVGAEDLSDLAAWFCAVEASRAFQLAAGFDGWSFEVRIDAC